MAKYRILMSLFVFILKAAALNPNNEGITAIATPIIEDLTPNQLVVIEAKKIKHKNKK